MLSAAALRARAQALGFNFIGLTPARPSPQVAAYLAWVEAGMHGAMGYLARPDRVARRRDLNIILPGAQSLVIVGLDYNTYHVDDEIRQNPLRGRIAAYAWGVDYHALLGPRLEELAAWISAQSAAPARHRAYVDTGAVLERSHAQQAGLGFIGKNTLLINPRAGSGFFLGEILTTASFDSYDAPHRLTQCGTCARCLTACPTQAFPRPYVLDARRCISYLTIEYDGWIDHDLRPLMGNWLFGCDVCRDVCPWERFASPTPEPSFYPLAPEIAAPFLADWLNMPETLFDDRFRHTPLHRAGHAQLVRNACIAAGNSRAPELVPYVEDRLADRRPLVRGHAAWALAHMRGPAAIPTLRTALADETEPAVLADVAKTLENMGQ
jgi:epoxyqueuosine reductase